MQNAECRVKESLVGTGGLLRLVSQKLPAATWALTPHRGVIHFPRAASLSRRSILPLNNFLNGQGLGGP